MSTFGIPDPGRASSAVEMVVAGASPLDALKQTRLDGSEFWSARDLSDEMRYDQWRNFAAAVDRARVSVGNQGQDPEHHIAGASKMVRLGSGAERAVDDFHLTRFGAYLTVMNGDPRKPEVAAAQAYFAIRTREAEMAPAAPALTGAELFAHAVLEAQAMLAAKDERIAELEPKAEIADRFLNTDGDVSVGDAAQILTRAGIKTGRGRMFATLEGKTWIYRARGDGRYRVCQRAIDAGWMSVLPQTHYHPKTGELVLDPPQPRVTPKGLQRLLIDLGGVAA